ncbi:MAG: 6-phosphogluconolactonase [Ignavibacteriales bacterium]|nr:6-phosphogluconolactonase [Ignavibacteriota bacterium]MCB9248699.1 6-phosphogluconolactonase [Ignavibacteriales bacterium]
MIKIFPTPKETVKKFAEELKLLIDKSSSKKKFFYIALSGGSTPKLLFKELKKNYLESINWQFVHIFWGDERCVVPESDESNFGVAQKLLLSKIKIPKENIHRIKGEDKPNTEARRYSGEIMMNVPSKNNMPKFDLIILGLGTDGHTASIFPNQIKLFDSENYCDVAVQPKTRQKRITITGKVINNSENIYFLVTGKEKSEVVAEILNKKGNYKKHPASYVVPTWGNVKWYLDKASSQMIEST